jgi:two-component system phosphate regulon sensor histidine kinase PhoR
MVIAIIRDVTERMRAEETLRHQRDELVTAYTQLKELDRLQSKFITDVSHELRTPVTNLHLYFNLLERGKPDKQQQYLAILKEQVARLVNLVEDITDVSHLELDNLTATIGNVNLNAIANQIVTGLQSRAVDVGLTLTFDPDLNLPPVRAVRDQLSRVVANLVMNAISYTAEGLVRVSTYHTPDRVCLQVQDTGLGIAPEDLPHLFKRFYRGRDVSHIPGNGLGLAVAHEIVRFYGGQIEAESHAGQGSTFTACLPPA